MSQEFQQRLVAVLYADVAGYSRLTGDDEIATHHSLRESLDLLSESITQHGGDVVHYAGDAILAKFDTASKALTSAVDIQREIRAKNQGVAKDRVLNFRIGINIGEVILDRDDIYGDGVNIAARLEALADPGGICVSRAVYDSVGSRLPYRFEDMGEKKVKNINQPVRCYRVDCDSTSDDVGNEPPPQRRGSRRTAALSAAVLTAIAGALYLWQWSSPQPPSPDSEPTVAETTLNKDSRLSIAVLPFSNLSGDAEQEYFSDGITNDIITDLSQISKLLVIASNSVFVYKNTPVKVQQVAQDLGVTHVLEGSVQKSGNQVRINAQLIDAATGHHLWAERFDRQLVDIFTLQDEVSRKIVDTLAVKLSKNEKQQLDRSRIADPQAYDMLLKGLEQIRRFTRETNIESRQYFEQAIQFDPGFARAYADVALSHAMDIQFGWELPSEEKFSRAFEHANKALALDDTLGQVHFSNSILYLLQKKHTNAIDSAKQSVTWHPNYADGWAQYAQALVYAGRPQEALEKIHIAMEINPHYAFFYTWIEGHAQMLLGNYDQAESAFLDVVERNAHFPGSQLTLAALYAQLGRMDDAEWIAAEILTLSPEFSLTREAQVVPYKLQEHLDFYIDGLRKAGLPE
jgi:adenylate cyclase